MLLIGWNDLPDILREKEVGPYYSNLLKKQASLLFKRFFDFVISVIGIIILLPVFVIIAVLIRINSKGPIFYKQTRITQYGRSFRIFKFRTMSNNADEIGPLVTVNNDSRITKEGRVLRKYRLDELPQLFNIVAGDMSFVGTRPEVPKYVNLYSKEMLATLLLPAGVTSLASIQFINEDALLSDPERTDDIYINQVLPEKMKYNLLYLSEFSLLNDIKLIMKTLKAVFCRKTTESKVEVLR